MDATQIGCYWMFFGWGRGWFYWSSSVDFLFFFFMTCELMSVDNSSWLRRGASNVFVGSFWLFIPLLAVLWISMIVTVCMCYMKVIVYIYMYLGDQPSCFLVLSSGPQDDFAWSIYILDLGLWTHIFLIVAYATWQHWIMPSLHRVCLGRFKFNGFKSKRIGLGMILYTQFLCHWRSVENAKQRKSFQYLWVRSELFGDIPFLPEMHFVASFVLPELHLLLVTSCWWKNPDVNWPGCGSLCVVHRSVGHGNLVFWDEEPKAFGGVAVNL